MKLINRLLAVLALATLSLGAFAQSTWPTRPVRIIVAFPAGAPGDLIARLIQPSLQSALGQPVVVENKPGAGGNIGMGEVQRATDGHTLLVGPDTMFTVNPHVYKKLGFKPLDDLAPVTLLAAFSQELVCHPSAGIKSLPDLLAASRKSPMSYASGGSGVPGHMAMEMLLASTGTRMQHVPYRGPAPAMQDVLAGTVPCGFLASPVVGPQVKDGRLIGIAVSGSRRLGSQPTVPTAAEAGVQGYDATFHEIVAMPRATPPAVLNRVQAEIAKAIAAPEVRSRLAALDLEVVANTPAEAEQRLRQVHAQWGRVVDRIQLQLD